MHIRHAILVAFVLALVACSSGSDPYRRPTPTQSASRAEATVEPPDWMKTPDYRHGGPVPPMEPNRKVNEQTCTQGVELTAGNLRCK